MAAQYKGELFIGVILHPLKVTGNYIINTLHMILFKNQSEDPDSRLPALFRALSLSVEISRRGLLGSKGREDHGLMTATQ